MLFGKGNGQDDLSLLIVVIPEGEVNGKRLVRHSTCLVWLSRLSRSHKSRIEGKLKLELDQYFPLRLLPV